jgi:hypothetical protein
MSYSQVTISSGVISERVGDELLVIVPGRTGTVRLTGYAADLFLDIRAGTKVDTADLVVADLVDLGITQASGMSRRGLIKAGAIGAGAGIAVLAMPGVAAASSSSRGDEGSLPLFPLIIEGSQLSYPSGGLSTTPQLSGTIYLWRTSADNVPSAQYDPALVNISSVVVDSVVRTAEWAVNGFVFDRSGYQFGSNVAASDATRIEMDFAYGDLEYYFLYTAP